MRWMVIILVVVMVVFGFRKLRKGHSNPLIDAPLSSEEIVSKALEMEDKENGVIAIDNHLGKRFYTDPALMSAAEKNFMYVEEVEREVNNGGFAQFFHNTSGDTAHESLAALKLIGAHKAADLLSKAMAQFPDGSVPTDGDERMAVLEEIEGQSEALWQELGDRFYEYEDDIAALLMEYVRANKDQFH